MIRTRRLLLRPAHRDDLAPLHAIFSHPRAMRYWDRPPHSALAQTQNYLNGFMAADADPLVDRFEFIIELDGVPIGKAGCWMKAEIGYIIHPDHWRRGYAREALRALIPGAFRKFADTNRLTAEIDPRNIGSARLLEQMGFVRTGYEKRNFLYGDKEWCDTAYYALPRSEARRLTSGSARSP